MGCVWGCSGCQKGTAANGASELDNHQASVSSNSSSTNPLDEANKMQIRSNTKTKLQRLLLTMSTSSSDEEYNSSDLNEASPLASVRSLFRSLARRARRRASASRIEAAQSSPSSGQFASENLFNITTTTTTTALTDEHRKRKRISSARGGGERLTPGGSGDAISLADSLQSHRTIGDSHNQTTTTGKEACERFSRNRRDCNKFSRMQQQQKPRNELRTSAEDGGYPAASSETNMQNNSQNDNNSERVELFVSIQQLCFEIIQCQIIANLIAKGDQNHRTSDEAPSVGQSANDASCLCLFVFGKSGSCMGELVLELVEHSPLVTTMNNSNNNNNNQIVSVRGPGMDDRDGQDQETKCNEVTSKHHPKCPMFHYIDVGSLVAANIDKRIREYHRLLEQTVRLRQKQVALLRQSDTSGESYEYEAAENDYHFGGTDEEQVEDDEDQGNNNNADDDDDEDMSNQANAIISNNLVRSHEPSVVSELSSECQFQQQQHQNPIRSEQQRQQQVATDSITLSTKQRSILQLKLIKYSNCITAKWIFNLIQDEINHLEQQQQQLSSSQVIDHLARASPRVYLINLVPNQLSLFKSCLYLQQKLVLRNFKYPYWGLQFERRTNIKLMVSERAKNAASNTASNKGPTDKGLTNSNKKKPQILSTNTRFLRSGSPIPIPHSISLMIGGRSDKRSPSVASEMAAGKQQPVKLAGPVEACIESIAVSLMTENVNEKLGPKFQENFAQQLSSMSRLTKLRYNPTRNYNYAFNQHEESLKQAHSCSWLLTSAAPNTMAGQSSEAPIKCPSTSDGPQHEQQQQQQQQRGSFSLAGPTRQTEGQNGNISRPVRSSLSPSIQSDSGGHHLLAPSPSPSPSLLSSDQSLAPSSSPGDCHSMVSASSANSRSFSFGSTRWAIELELVDNSTSSTDEADQQRDKKSSSTSSWLRPATPTPGRGEDSGPTNGSANWQTGHRQQAGSEATDLDQHHHHHHHHHLENAAMRDPSSRRIVLHVYRPTRATASRSPLSFASPSVLERHPTTGQYHLVETRIVYPNGGQQSVLEARRASRRPVKFKTGSSVDVAKLMRLIERVRRQLIQDLDGWLAETILLADQQELHGSNNNNAQQQHQQSSLADRFRRHSASTGAHHNQHQQQHRKRSSSSVVHPSLVVNSIRIDVSKLTRTQELTDSVPSAQVPLSSSLKSLPKLRLNDHENNQESGESHTSEELHEQQQQQQQQQQLPPRPNSSSEANNRCPSFMGATVGGNDGLKKSNSSANIRRPRVHFSLAEPPRESNPDGHCDQMDCTDCSSRKPPAQRRLWIDDNLFVCCENPNLVPLLGEFAKWIQSSRKS